MTPQTSVPDKTVRHRTILALAMPIMLSNVSTPLLGAVDTAVTKLGAAALQRFQLRSEDLKLESMQNSLSVTAFPIPAPAV